MRKNKLFLITAAVTVFAFTAAACGSSSQEAGSATGSESAAESSAEASENNAEGSSSGGGVLVGTVPAGDDTESGGTEIISEGPSDAGDGSGETDENGGLMSAAAPTRIWGVIESVDENGLTVDNRSDVSSKGEMILHIDPEKTVVTDINGVPVSIDDIQAGSFEAYLGEAMTMSIPPQNTPYVIIVNIPEDAKVPRFIVADGAVSESGGVKELTSGDGEVYEVSDETEVSPFRTKNIVTLDDIDAGTPCLIWADEDSGAQKIVILR